MAERVVVTSSKKINAKNGYRRLAAPFDLQRVFAGVATWPEPQPRGQGERQRNSRGKQRHKRNDTGVTEARRFPLRAFTHHEQRELVG
jgi:hypothetical protein